MKLLVVEDNVVNRRLARVLLLHKGHDMAEVATAAEAIATLDSGPLPDVVLLDIQIPGGGLSVVAHVRATPSLAGLAVIAHTALAMRGDRERFLAAGCDGYIAKPISVKTFVAEIETILRERLRT
jgi:two-component system cell cycle response regulator DivK